MSEFFPKRKSPSSFVSFVCFVEKSFRLRVLCVSVVHVHKRQLKPLLRVLCGLPRGIFDLCDLGGEILAL